MESKGNQDHAKEKEMVFLSDRPLGADKEQQIRFGHRSIVENLRDVVSKCPTPFTIGLLGRWGTGKTTILDALTRKYHASEVAVVMIDAWKHEGDALRRTFLQDTINQLRERQGQRQYLSKQVELSRNLRVPISRTFRSGIKASRRLQLMLIAAVMAIIGIGILIDRFAPDDLGTYMAIVSSGGLIGGIFFWLLQQSITTEEVTTVVDRFQDPQEFESEFKDIIEKVAAERLLVIVDNLDRVSCDKAVELLSTIKTFLEQDKCVFLIACDAKAIKKHLESLYGPSSDNSDGISEFDGDEYLRKFFNSYLIIPEFIDTELYTYTEALLDESNLHAPDRPDVAYVITKAFRDNPRQIKQFVNTLISHLALAKHRETARELPEGMVTKNVAYMAKDLIVRLRFSTYYDSWARGEPIGSGSMEFDDFLRATKPIDVTDNRPFRYLKLSEQEIELPEIGELQRAFEDNDVQQANPIIEGFKTDARKLSAFRKFVPSLVDRNKGRGLLLFNIVSSVLTSTKKLGIEFDRLFYHSIADLLNDDDQIGTHLQNFDTSVVFGEVLGRLDGSPRPEIIRRYSGLFSEPDNISRDDRDSYVRDLLQEFMGHAAWLNNTMRQEVRGAIAQKYCNYETLSTFIGKPDQQREFLGEETLGTFIAGISESDLEQPEQLVRKTKLIAEFKAITTEKSLSEIVTRFTGLLSTESTKPDRDEKRVLLTCVEEIVDTYKERIADLPEDTVDPLAEQILKVVSALAQPGRKSMFVPLCVWLVDVVADPLKGQINSVINAILSGASSDDLALVFNKIPRKREREELIGSYSDTLKQRSLKDQSIFDYLYPLADKGTRTAWLNELIEVDHQRAIQKLEQLKYRVDDKKSVLSAIFTKVSKLPKTMQRRELLFTCNRMRCAGDANLKGKFVEIIKDLLRDTTPDAQRMGLELLQDATHLSQTQKRDIAIETIDWLCGLQPDAALQPSSAEAVLLVWSVLTAPPRDKFLYYVFDILIRRGGTTQSIQLGLDVITRIEPKLEYEDCPKYFDDLLSRAEMEPDANIRSVLIDGLKSLDPKKWNEHNRSFWRKVRKLSSAKE